MIPPISTLSINTIRTLTIDSIEKAQHGHPGMPLGAAPMAYVLWKYFLKQNPKHPSWFNRDRFVLSAGHGSMLLYALLHLSGYDVSLDDLKNFRQLGSKTPGHPEYGVTPGVEATTGPLGQGIPTAVGMAMAERYFAEKFNREGFPIVDHLTYTICGDGDLMEGVSSEAASLAGHLKLGRLIVLYDSNNVSLDGNLSLAYSDDTKKRFESYGWQVISVSDGNDLDEIKAAIRLAQSDLTRPSLIEIKTTIGYGAPSIEGTHKAHSDPLGPEEIKRAKQNYNWHYNEPFYVAEAVYQDFASIQSEGEKREADWNNLLTKYKQSYPELYTEFTRILNGDFPLNWEAQLPAYDLTDQLATRVASSQALNILAHSFTELIGGSADLDASTRIRLKDFDDFQAQTYSGRNIRFGVREFAMAAIANGLALHHLRPFVSTFFVFSDYLRPALRLSALMKLPVIYVFTHDSVAVGQDGPTHQPIEHLASFRAMPNVTILRPADGNETSAAWAVAMKNQDGPTLLILGRQTLPTLEGTKEKAREGVSRGAYVLSEAAGDPDGLLIATGSEVHLAIKAQKVLEKENIYVSVISMPSWELFEKQSETYKERVLPRKITRRLVLEMGSKLGWREYAGAFGKIMSIDEFGCSGPGDQVIEKFGFTVDNVVKQFKEML